MILAICPTLAVAQEPSIFGEWCNDEGDPVWYVEAEGVGIGEHRICDWVEPPVRADTHTSVLRCRNVTLYEGEVVEFARQEFLMEFTATGPDRMRVTGDDGAAPFDYSFERCNWGVPDTGTAETK